MTQEQKSGPTKSENESQAGRSARTSEFEDLVDEKQMSLIREFMLFVVENKAWWMIPIILVLAAVGILVLLGSTGAAPFIYTLF